MGHRKLGLMAAALLPLALAASASADVYVTSPSTGRILVLDSTGAVTREIGGSGGLYEPFAIAIDSRRNLLVTDYAAGRIVRYATDGSNAGVAAANIPKPDGLSIGPSGDLFLVSRENRTFTRLRSATGDLTSSLHRDVWMVPAGSAIPTRIATIDESFRLAQTALVPAGPYQGDLLVLSTRPGVIARLRQTAPATFERSIDYVSFVPGEPTSMAFSRAGDLLVSTSDGRVLRYSDTGLRLQPDFATGLPSGPTRLSIGGDGIVHVTAGGPAVIRFDPYGTRLADLTGPTAPIAAAVADGCVPTPQGTNVAVSPAAGVNVIFDQVSQAGVTCLQTTALEAGVTGTPGGNTIPGFARKLWEDEGFVVYQLTTTALFKDSIAEEFFSYNPESRLLHASGTGKEMEDTTTLVTPNDPRGRTGTFSEFVVYLDTRPASEVALLKLDRLRSELTAAQEVIDETLFSRLSGLLDQIVFQVGQGGPDADRAGAIQNLIDLKRIVRENSGEGIPNMAGPEGGVNVTGILLSWADTLVFSLSL